MSKLSFVWRATSAPKKGPGAPCGFTRPVEAGVDELEPFARARDGAGRAEVALRRFRDGEPGGADHEAVGEEAFDVEPCDLRAGVEDREFVGVDPEGLELGLVPRDLAQDEEVGGPAGVGLERRAVPAVGGGVGDEEGVRQREALPSGGEVEGEAVARAVDVAADEADVGVLPVGVVARLVGEEFLARGGGGDRGEGAVGVEVLGQRRDAVDAVRGRSLRPSRSSLRPRACPARAGCPRASGRAGRTRRCCCRSRARRGRA